MIYPITISETPENTKYPEGYTECKQDPICMREIKDIKEAVLSYGIYSPYVSQLVKT